MHLPNSGVTHWNWPSTLRSECYYLWILSMILSMNEIFPKSPHAQDTVTCCTPCLRCSLETRACWAFSGRGAHTATAQASSSAVSLSQSWLLIAAPRDHYKRSNKHRRHGKGHRPRTRLLGFQFYLPFTLCMTLTSHLNFFGFCSLICKMRIIIMPRSHRLVMAGRLDTCELFTIVPGTWQRLDTLVIIVLFIIITSVSAFNL